MLVKTGIESMPSYKEKKETAAVIVKSNVDTVKYERRQSLLKLVGGCIIDKVDIDIAGVHRRIFLTAPEAYFLKLINVMRHSISLDKLVTMRQDCMQLENQYALILMKMRASMLYSQAVFVNRFKYEARGGGGGSDFLTTLTYNDRSNRQVYDRMSGRMIKFG
jgi:hypothetical protein